LLPPHAYCWYCTYIQLHFKEGQWVFENYLAVYINIVMKERRREFYSGHPRHSEMVKN
jgi:hypothetical protein